MDANNVLQTVNYVSDDVLGFRVAATNLPQGDSIDASSVLSQASNTNCFSSSFFSLDAAAAARLDSTIHARSKYQTFFAFPLFL